MWFVTFFIVLEAWGFWVAKAGGHWYLQRRGSPF